MNRFLPHTKWLIALIFAALFLSGCTVQLAYNNLDRLMLRWIDQKVELNSDQSRLVREALNENLDWHCREHLPQYVDLLESLDADLKNGRLDQGRLFELSDQVAFFGGELIEVSIPTATELMASLDDDQVQQLFQSFEKSNQDLVDRLAESDQIKMTARRADRMERRLKRFMGRLSNEQRARIQDWANAYQSTDENQLAYAHRWQEALGEALSIREEAPELFAERMGKLLDPGSGWDDGYRLAIEANQELSWVMLSDVLALATNRQRQRLSGKLRSYANDFQALSCQEEMQLASTERL